MAGKKVMSQITPEMSMQIAEMYANWYTAYEIAKQFGVTATTAMRHVHKHNIPRKVKPKDPCQGCIYLGKTFDGDQHVPSCDYFIITGKLRSLICPPGDKCTVKKVMANQKGEEASNVREEAALQSET